MLLLLCYFRCLHPVLCPHISQVRDMTGDGTVIKRRLREGKGEFPVDCPLHDTRLTLHYRVRAAAAPGQPPGPWLHDTLSGGACATAAAAEQDWGAAAAATHTGATSADTGCGELPEAVELCAKLMVPGEWASTAAAPSYAYAGRTDAPAGLDPNAPAEFELVLLEFEREGYWQSMPWEERWALAERIKAKANDLHKRGQHGHAISRCVHCAWCRRGIGRAVGDG